MSNFKKEECYNTLRPKIILNEYGRHIQDLVEFIKTVKDKQEREKLATIIVKQMANFYPPQQRESTELKIKLWNHLARIANYELDIEYPYPIYKPDDLKFLRKPIPLPQKREVEKKYGVLIEKMAKKIILIEDENLKYALLSDLANYLKKFYTINSKEIISNEQIIAEIKELTQNPDIDESKIIFNNNIKSYNKKYKKTNSSNSHTNNITTNNSNTNLNNNKQ
ncbi:MAG: DUF4290 domain-containing protein [Bacteroidales bacterium]|nr:DUF4290 domain-containing protein [Bacteroidales bacterium]